MPYKCEIAKQGNDLTVRLPREILDELGLEQGDLVTVSRKNGHIEIEPTDLDYNRAVELSRKFASRYRNEVAKRTK